MNPTDSTQPHFALAAGALAAAAAPDVSPEIPFPEMLPALTPTERDNLAHELIKEQINSINLWADNNRREAKWESFWFWALKVPVIVATAGYGLIPSGWELALAGAVSAACVLIDGLYRPRQFA